MRGWSLGTLGVFTGFGILLVMAGVVSFLMIWGEGGHMLADDKRVTQTAQA